MIYRVRTLPAADADIHRLVDFLIERDVAAASRAYDLILDGISSLAQLPARGRPTRRPDVRELVLWFGRSAYMVRYRIRDHEVAVMSVRHSLEKPQD